MDHDFYWLFSRFWWLMFPLFWMVMALAWGWSRHSRANRALDIIKAYAEQGKEPPPELLKTLQGGTDGHYGWGGPCGGGGRYSAERRLHRALLFTALAFAFGFLAFWNHDDGGHWHHPSGLLLPVIFAALAFSNFLSLLFMSRGLPPYDKDGPPR